MLSQDPPINEVLSCVLWRDADTSRWLGHCLDFDVATSGRTEDEAWANLRDIVRAHIEHCFTHHRDGLRLTASDQEWKTFRFLKGRQPMLRSEKITLRLVPPQKDPARQFWIQSVESMRGLENDYSTVPVEVH